MTPPISSIQTNPPLAPARGAPSGAQQEVKASRTFSQRKVRWFRKPKSGAGKLAKGTAKKQASGKIASLKGRAVQSAAAQTAPPQSFHAKFLAGEPNPVRFGKGNTPSAVPKGSKFYQEAQSGGWCSTHSLNGFAGGPMLSRDNQDFLEFQAHYVARATSMDVADARAMLGDSGDPAPMQSYLQEAASAGTLDPKCADAKYEGFRPLGMKTPLTKKQKKTVQAHYNAFPGDRLLVCEVRQGASHVFALRKNQAGEWFLVDSLKSTQPKVNLGAFLLKQQTVQTNLIHLEAGYNFSHAANPGND